MPASGLLNGLHSAAQGPQQPEANTDIASKASMPIQAPLVFMSDILSGLLTT